MIPPDLRALEYDGFVSLVFDHPAYEGQDVELDGTRVVRILEERPREWYWDVEWNWEDLPNDPLHTLELMTSLFERGSELWARFTARQIAQGFNLVIGVAGSDPFFKPVWNAALPWEPRERLLKAVLPLYEGLFDVHVEIEHVPFMFWDSVLGYRYQDPSLAFPPSADDRRIQESVANIIRDLLIQLNGPWSAPSGLHGAHHVNHALAYDAVEQWLASPINLDEDWRKYGERVLRGDAM